MSSAEPQTLEFSLTSLPDGPRHLVRWENGRLIYHNRASQVTAEARPSPDHWQWFWDILEALGVWSWHSEYLHPGIYDGYSWGLDVAHGDRQLSTGGSNAEPTTLEHLPLVFDGLLGQPYFRRPENLWDSILALKKALRRSPALDRAWPAYLQREVDRQVSLKARRAALRRDAELAISADADRGAALARILAALEDEEVAEDADRTLGDLAYHPQLQAGDVLAAMEKAPALPSADHFFLLVGQQFGPRLRTLPAELWAGLRHPRPRLRLWSARVLASAGGAARPAVAELCALLADPYASVREAAAQALAGTGPGGEAVLQALTRRLTDPTLSVRTAAFQTLAAVDPAGRVPLATLLAHLADPEAEVRVAVVTALRPRLIGAGLHHSPVYAALVQLAGDADPGVRLAAVGALGADRQAAEAAQDVMVRALADDAARRAAALSLARLGTTAAAAAAPLARQFLSASASVERWELLHALHRVAPWTFPVLLAEQLAALPPVDLALLGQAAAYVRPRHRGGVPRLLEVLSSPHPAAQQWAVMALGYLGAGAAEALPALQEVERAAPPGPLRQAAKTARMKVAAGWSGAPRPDPRRQQAWAEAGEPAELFGLLRAFADEGHHLPARPLLLFVAACHRRADDLTPFPDVRRRVEAWEERAEEFRATEPPDEPEWRAAEEAAALLPGAEAAWLLRCLVGDPWRPVLVDPEWVLGPRGVLPLAQAAAEERTAPHGQLDGDRLRVLADALEEAGCADAAILQHLRQPGPHAPGCHVLEALLGRD